jgi:hypothetical protein
MKEASENDFTCDINSKVCSLENFVTDSSVYRRFGIE